MSAVLLLLAGLLAPRVVAAPATGAAQPPAVVTALEGSATRARAAGQPAPLHLGDAVGQGDVLATAAASRLELRLADASLLRLGPSAKVQLSAAHFGATPAQRRVTAKLFFGDLWAKVTSVVQGDQKFQIETENAVAGVRGTAFRVEARADRSVRVAVYAGTVAVGANAAKSGAPADGRHAPDGGERPDGARAPATGRHEIAGPSEVSREQWEKLVGRQMQLVIEADGTPGDPTGLAAGAEQADDLAAWNPKAVTP